MTQVAPRDDVSLLVVGTILVRKRWRILQWMLVGAAVAAALAFTRPALYLGTASFVSKGSDSGRSGLASLAGQFGVALPAADASVSPEFYMDLIKSRVLLLPIARDTFVVPELGSRRISFIDLFEIQGKSRAESEEQGLKLLKTMISVSSVKATGVVQLSVSTRWPSVSLAIATALVRGVNDYNEKMRQGRASAERKFVEARMEEASADLRQAEDRLAGFMATNRQFGGSPGLTFERERRQRDVTMKEALFSTLSQSYQEARIREIRDTPVITIFEPPWVPVQPEPRGRARIVILGFFLGGLISAFIFVTAAMMARRGSEGSEEVREFAISWDEAKKEMFGHTRWFGKRA